MTEGFRAWMIPDDKRELAINIINRLVDAISPRTYSDLGYDYYSDPIMKFENFDVLSQQNQKFVEQQMFLISAKNVTEMYAD